MEAGHFAHHVHADQRGLNYDLFVSSDKMCFIERLSRKDKFMCLFFCIEKHFLVRILDKRSNASVLLYSPQTIVHEVKQLHVLISTRSQNGSLKCSG